MNKITSIHIGINIAPHQLIEVNIKNQVTAAIARYKIIKYIVVLIKLHTEYTAIRRVCQQVLLTIYRNL
jgi:hypothetical protein